VHRFVALALSLAIPVAAAAAPLLHAHPGDRATAHHRGATVHSHWSGHGDTPAAGHSHDDDHDAGDGRAWVTSDAPIFDTLDPDRAIFFSTFVAVTPPLLPTPGIVPNAVALPVPHERAAHLNVEVAHGHDPPFTRSLPARAPPSLPVLI
jgi:hypothetical protein